MAGAAITDLPDGTETLSGTVERVVYHDERSRYTVARLRVAGFETLVSAVGRSAGLDQGADVTLSGQWEEHPTHGRQFSFSRLHVEVPTTVAGIERRLMRYPGVKQVMAARIVARFGSDTLEILAKQPRRLLEVDGIGPRTLSKIVEHHEHHTGPVAELEAQLLELDLPPYLAEAIHRRYPEDAISMLRDRPYRLAREVRGIGFATADRIARAQGIAPDSDERIEAGLLHCMEQAQSEGNCALPIEQLVSRAVRSLGVAEPGVRAAGERLVAAGELALELGNDGTPLAFPRALVEAERDVAESLYQLGQAPQEQWVVGELPEHLSRGQVEAVQACSDHGVVVLTGGPGTGKSTVVHNVIDMAKDNGWELLLAAPTGRAAKRLEQTTGEPAKTIHRMLEFQPETGKFSYGPGNPLPAGLVVVDESSMLDIALAQCLLGALTPQHRLLLVGDSDQLPSVGAGNVLGDIMAAAQTDSTPLRLVRLTVVFRQAEGSSIVTNAHRILAGQMPVADPPAREDGAQDKGQFFVVPARSPEHAHELIVRMATERIPEAYGLDGRTQVQVLTPMHKGKGGTEALNRALQDCHTAGETEIELRSGGLRRFRVGDRVMQTRNDYDKAVFNGDVGAVVAINTEDSELTVDMDGQRVSYVGKEMGALQLAYAVSIHKSQGSEFPAVIVSVLPEHHVMLRRNLIYTAVTRAQGLCVIVGDPRSIERAVRRVESGRRHTGLTRRILECFGTACETVEPAGEPAAAVSPAPAPRPSKDVLDFDESDLPSLDELIEP